MTPSQGLEAFQAGTLKGSDLMRVVVEYSGYLVPGSLAHAPLDAYFGTTDEPTFQLFEDSDSFDLWCKVNGEQPLFTGPYAGMDVIRTLRDDLAFLNLNPDSPNVFHYRKNQLPDLKQLAESIVIERSLHDPARAEEMFTLLRNYDRFQMLLRSGGSAAPQMVLAPDNQGRKLIPVFTANDSFDAYLEVMLPRLQEELQQPLVVTRSGVELFTQLAGLPVDGIVFNPLGKSRPKAFALAICSEILARG